MANKKKKEETKTTEKKETKKKTTPKKTTMDKQIEAAFKESVPKNFVETRNLTLYGSKSGKKVTMPIMGRKELPVVKTQDGDLKIDAPQKVINSVIDTNYQAAQTKKKQTTKKSTTSTKKSTTSKKSSVNLPNDATKKAAKPATSLTTSRLPTTENAIKKTNLTNSLINYRQGPIRANRVDLQDSQQRMKFVDPALKLPTRPYDFVEHSKKTIEKKFQDTYSRNNIVPDSFSINDFYKWANEHNFEPRMNGSMQVYYTPKYEGKVLGFGGKKLTTEQDERDFEVLKALAENNERRKINAGKNKAYDRFLSTMDVLTLGGSTMIHDARAKNEYQKSGLNPKNFIGYEDIIKKPINTEKIGTTAINAVNAGNSSAAKAFAAGLDFIMPTDFLGDYDWFSYVNRRFGEDQEAYSAAMMQSAKGNKALEIGGQVLMGVTAALPHTLLAMMSGGLSAIGGVAPQAGNGTAAAIKAVTTSMAKNPLYWSSFLSNVGIEYEDAINNGADEKTASISAVLVAMINSGIEIGGGIEMLPKEIMKGNGRNLWKLVKSSIEEGGEEVFQGMISRGMSKIMYDSEREVFSIKTEDAVINPLTSAKEFGMGTAVGAFLGGGPALGSMIIDAGRNVTAKNLKKDGSRMGIVRELYRNGFNETNNNADVATAEAIIRMANNTASEADIEFVGRSDAAKNIVRILANDKKAAQAVIDANAAEKPKGTEAKVDKVSKKATKQIKNTEENKATEENSVIQEMAQRIGKKIIVVPEKITSILDSENGRESAQEYNGVLFVDEKRLSEEYDAFYETGKKGIPFEEIPDDIETVILDEQAARAAYEMGQEAEIKEKPKSIEKESTVIKATEKQKGMIVQNAEAEQMKRMQPKAYSNIEHMANELGVNVTFVKKLTNSKGQKLDGVIDETGIKINVNAEDPVRFAATHEFSHRMKQLDEKGWKTYQDYVVKYWQKQGDYDVKMQALSEAYGGEMSIDELHEELACDFGEEMFKSEAVLTDFIKKDRTLAEKIKDVWFKVLSAFSDKARLRHAQNLWAKCYNNAVEKAENGENSFVGEKFSYAGVSAETADITALSDAQNMERDGKNAEEIWKKTGWSRGLDRKWRFEIDDLESSLIEKPAVRLHHDSNSDYYTGKLEDILNHPKLFKAYPSLKNVDVIIQETNPGISGTAFTKSNQIVLSKTLFEKISSEYEDLINNRRKYIDKIEATPEFKEYNAIYEMKDEELSAEEWLKLEKAARDKFFSSELGKRYYELVWGKDKTVKKYEIGWSDKAKEVLIHEIQHLIQYKEGFASGASVKYWQKQLDKGFDSRTKEEKKTLAKLQNEFYELIKTDPEFFREMEKLTSMKPDVPRGAINWETLEKIEEDSIEWKNYDKKLNELEEKFGAEKVSKFILLNSKIEEQKKKGRTAGDLYYDTAGEREARNAAERINMSADERRNKFPESFKSDDDIVFAEEGTVSSYVDVDDKGNKVTVITENQGLFLGLDKKEMAAAAEKFANERYKNKTLPISDDLVAIVEKRGLNKYLHSTKSKGSKGANYHASKIKAIGELENLLKNASFDGSSQDKKNHSFAKYGFEHYKTVFAVDGQVFEGIIDVGFSEKGVTFYGMTNVKRVTDVNDGRYFNLLLRYTSAFTGNSDDTTISQNGQSVNSNSMQNGENNASKSKISGVKEVEEKISARKLEEENKRLREQIENMHIQLNQAEGKGLDLKSIKEAARRIKETYHSTIPLSTIHQELSRIYTAMSSSEADGSEINKKIVELSNKVIDNAIIKNDERSLRYADLLRVIKNTKISVSENEKKGFADGFENFRKSAFGKLKLSNDGVDIDAFWDDLTTEYPFFFSENILDTEERLNEILRIRQELQPVYDSYYGNDENISIAKTALANDIMESFFSIPEGVGKTKYVFYDKRASQAEKALKKAEETYKKTLKKVESKYEKNFLTAAIDRDFNYLSNMLTNPTDSRHVPEEMKGNVAYLLSLFDFGTKRADELRNKGIDRKTVKSVKLAEMADAYEKIMRETFGVTGVQNENNIMFDKVLAEDVAELKAEIDSSEIGKFKRIEDMSLSELQTAQKIIRGIHHMVTNKNKAFSNGIKENIHDLGIAVIKESANERKSKSSKRNIEGDRKEWGEGKPQTIRTLLNTLDNLVNYDNLAAYDFFHRIGGTMETLYRELRKGFDKHAWNIKEAEEKISDIIGKTKVDKWTGNKAKAQEFTTASGKIRLTP